MPSRLKRYQTFDQDHFITFTCYHRLPFLDKGHARDTFEEILETLRERHQFLIHGYVIMPNHVHLLLSEPKLHSLADTMRALKTETSKRLKGDRPHFWQRATRTSTSSRGPNSSKNSATSIATL